MNRSADKNNILMSFSGGVYSPVEITPKPDRVDLNVDLHEGSAVGVACERRITAAELEQLKAITAVAAFKSALCDQVSGLGKITPCLDFGFLSNGHRVWWSTFGSKETAETMRHSVSEVLAQSSPEQKLMMEMAKRQLRYMHAHTLSSSFHLKAEIKESLVRLAQESDVVRWGDYFPRGVSKTANDAVYPKEDEVKIRPLSEATTQRKRRPVVRATSFAENSNATNAVMGAARRVMRQHSKELEALANK